MTTKYGVGEGHAVAQLYKLRVGVPEPVIELIDTPQVMITAPGRDLDKLPAALNTTIAGWRSPEELIPTIDPTSGAGWVRSASDHEWATSAAVHMAADYDAMSKSVQITADRTELANNEYDNGRKHCLQNGSYVGWDILPKGFIADDPGFNFTKVAKLVVDGLTWGAVSAAGPFRRHTNQGAPTFGKSDINAMGMIAVALRGGTSVKDFVAAYERVCRHIDVELPLCSPILSRAGPLAKKMPLFWYAKNGRMEHVANMSGLAPRTRHVLSVPFCTYAALNDAYPLMSGALRSTAFAGGVLTKDMINARVRHALNQGYRWYNDDIEAFDWSVSKQLQIAVFNALRPHVGSFAVDMLQLISEMPVIGPPLAIGARAYMYDVYGMIRSGERATSWLGTVYNAIRLVIVLSAVFDISHEAARDFVLRSGRVLAWGDDSLVATPAPLSDKQTQLWQDTSASTGMRAKVASGAFFLRTVFGEPEPYMLATRAFTQTVWPERPSDELTIQLLGLFVRLTALKAHPHFQSVCDTLFSRANTVPCCVRWGIRNFADLTFLMTSKVYVEALLKASSKAGVPYLLAANAAASSPVSNDAAILRFLSATVGRPAAADQFRSMKHSLSMIDEAVAGNTDALESFMLDASALGAFGKFRAVDKGLITNDRADELMRLSGEADELA